MFPTHVLLIVIACVTTFVYGGGGKRPKVCRYSSDGPVCRTNIECSDPEVHCYRKPGHPYGRCCVKHPRHNGGSLHDILDADGCPDECNSPFHVGPYACPRGSSNRYDDPEGFPPLVQRCPYAYPFFCRPGYYCRTKTGGSTEFYGVCCPLRVG